jgi:hypothetical protein
MELPMQKQVLKISNVLATAGVLLAGYMFFSSLPDIRRYIRIGTM